MSSNNETPDPIPSGDYYYDHPHLSAMPDTWPVAPDAHTPEATGFFY
jgi:hypothetical protein